MCDVVGRSWGGAGGWWGGGWGGGWGWVVIAMDFCTGIIELVEEKFLEYGLDIV